MLSISRKIGESILIGEEIAITLLGITENRARIGITAPEETPVHREEVYLRVKNHEENP